MLITLVVFIFILGLLIFVHELGHFIAAKRSGIKVEEFAFGFPPRLFAVKRGETEYALNLLPFGGYVRMLGENDNDPTAEKKNHRSYAYQSPWVRVKVVVAGVLMNAVLAWLLITIGFWIGMPPVVTAPNDIPRANVQTSVVVAGIMPDSAADKMGLKPGDQIISINNQPMASQDAVSKTTTALKGQQVTVQISRNEEMQSLSGTLNSEVPPLGVQLADDSVVTLPFWWAPIYAIWETIKAAGAIFVGVMGFFKTLFSQFRVPAEAAGPVGIFYITRSVLDLGFGALLNFVAILSINLGVVNILPVPALDGGRLLFIILEKLNKGKKVVSARIENTAHAIGFILLILLILTITYHDVLRIGQ
jgi:regulator of sigma E protease